MNKANEQLEANRAAYEARLAQLEAEKGAQVSELRRELDTASTSAQKLQGTCGEQSVLIEQLTRAANESSAQLVETRARLSEQEKRANENGEQLVLRQNALNDAVVAADAVRMRLAEVQRAGEQELLALRAQLSRVEHELLQKTRDFARVSAEAQERQRQIISYESSMHRLVEDKRKLGEEYHKANAALTAAMLRQTEGENALKHAKSQHDKELRRACEERDSLNAQASARQAELEAAQARVNDLATRLAKVSDEFEKKKTIADDLFEASKKSRDYLAEYEKHYAMKKKMFETTEAELRSRLERTEHEAKEVSARLAHAEARLADLADQCTYLGEKNKTLAFENVQLKTQKDVLARRVNDMPLVAPIPAQQVGLSNDKFIMGKMYNKAARVTKQWEKQRFNFKISSFKHQFFFIITRV